MKDFFKHSRTYIFRGLLAITPLLLSVLAVKVLYEMIDKKVMSFIDNFVQVRQIPGLGILLLLICLYFVGLIVSNVIGRQFFQLIEGISERIPFIKAIYQVGKQLSNSLSVDEEKKAFQKTVLLDCNNNGVWSVAFITGQVIDARNGETLLKVFVPTVPNPATGFIMIAKPSQTIDPGWSIEEGIKMVVSAGIISPSQVNKT